MPEKLYTFLLKLYPDHFRRTYGEEALHLVRERARSEKGFVSRLRLWLDLVLDLAISLPREYSRGPKTPILATHPGNGERSFQLLAERSLNPTLLCLGGTLSLVLFWLCGFVVAHSGRFPALFPAPLLPQELAQSPAAETPYPYGEESPVPNLARDFATDGSSGPFVLAGGYSFCLAAKRDIPGDSVQPLFVFRFARPGASGVALIDGNAVKIFKNERRLSIRAHVIAGDHQFALRLDRPAENTFIFRSADFEDCQAK
ncbi:MAG TPA: hypothetical protein VHW24_10070 [Bryobacteraceae bacterium]|nr:hypothetical protein [Bryobacteraceae bacterium]